MRRAPSAFRSCPEARKAARSETRDPVDPFKRQHPPGAAAPIDLRHAKAFVVLGVLRHLRNGRSLHAQIHLDGDRLGQRLHHGFRPQPPRGWMEALDHARGEEIGVEVLVEALLDAGPQHLDRHRLQRAARLPDLRLVHLRDRGGGHRRAELGEERVDRRLQCLLHRGPRLGLREGRQPVLERGEVGGELAADDVVAGGKELPELDVGRSERGQGFRELRLVAAAISLLAERRRHPAEEPERRREPRLVGQHARAGPGDHGTCLGQSRHVGNSVHCVTVARRNGWRRCRRSGCGSAPAQSPHSRSFR